MQTEKPNYFNEDAMTSPVVEQNKIKCPSCGEDIMTNPNAEEKKIQCPSSGQDLMSIPKANQGSANYFNEDAMTSPIVEKNKIKYHTDVMAKPDAEENKN